MTVVVGGGMERGDCRRWWMVMGIFKVRIMMGWRAIFGLGYLAS